MKKNGKEVIKVNEDAAQPLDAEQNEVSAAKLPKEKKKEKKSKTVTEQVTESIVTGEDVDMEDVTVAKVS